MKSGFTQETVLLNVACDCWQQAVKAGVALLVRQHCVEERYAEAIICQHKTLGPYMVIAPGIMLAHARPQDGVLIMGLSLITLKPILNFGNVNNDPVQMVITLAASDDTSHLQMLAALAKLLMNQQDVNAISKACQVEEVLSITNRYFL